MFFAAKKLGNNAKHVDVAVMAVSFQSIAAKYFQSVAESLKIIGLITALSHIMHPGIDYLTEFSYNLLFKLNGLNIIIVMLHKNSVKDS